MEPLTLTAAAIATLVITKAFEKTSEIITEKTWQEGEKLLALLKEKEPSTANAVQLAQQQALDYGQAHLIGQQVEQAANKHPEIREAVEVVADSVKSQPSIIQNFTSRVDKNYGGNVGNVSIGTQNQNQTFNN